MVLLQYWALRHHFEGDLALLATIYIEYRFLMALGKCSFDSLSLPYRAACLYLWNTIGRPWCCRIRTQANHFEGHPRSPWQRCLRTKLEYQSAIKPEEETARPFEGLNDAFRLRIRGKSMFEASSGRILDFETVINAFWKVFCLIHFTELVLLFGHYLSLVSFFVKSECQHNYISKYTRFEKEIRGGCKRIISGHQIRPHMHTCTDSHRRIAVSLHTDALFFMFCTDCMHYRRIIEKYKDDKVIVSGFLNPSDCLPQRMWSARTSEANAWTDCTSHNSRFLTGIPS